jgi:hypothetical protein
MRERGNKVVVAWSGQPRVHRHRPSLIHVLASSGIIILMSHVAPTTYAVTTAGPTEVDSVLSQEIIQKKAAAYVRTISTRFAVYNDAGLR